MSFKLFLAFTLAVASLFTVDQLNQIAQFFQLACPFLMGVYIWRKMFKKATPTAPVLPVQVLPEDEFDFLDDDRPAEPSHAEADRDAELYEAGILQDECNDRNDEWYEERQQHY